MSRFSIEKLMRLLAGLNRRVEIRIVNTAPAHVQWIQVIRQARKG